MNEFEDLKHLYPEQELRQPSTRQGAEYECTRCFKIKGNTAFIAIAHPLKTGVCRKCCSQEERRYALSLPQWGRMKLLGKTNVESILAPTVSQVEQDLKTLRDRIQ